jgi:hypothetical protein
MAERGSVERRLTARVSRVVVSAALLMSVAPAGQAAGAPANARQGATAPRPEARPSDCIGILDFYGLRTVAEAQVRKALALKEGDRAPQSAAEKTEAVRRLEKVPDVEHARLARVCCDERGRSILYVGIAEKGSPRFTYHPAPTGRASLPPEMVLTSHRFEEALGEAVQKGDAGEDDSQGHSLATNSRLRSLQEQCIAYAASRLNTVRHVLRTAADAEQRQIAAWIIGYAPHKREVVDDLLYAVNDPDEGVRNDATRSLMAIAALAQRHPEAGIRIDAAPFIAMLNSVVWSDRNKAAAVLISLTAGRSARVLNPLRQRALPALVEMARWKSPGHAQGAFILLGRIVGLDEQKIWDAWARGARESVITRALVGS